MKTLAAVALAALVGLGWNAEAGADAAANGERLFIQKGCLGCHGTSGRGGAGPDLAGTGLSVEDLLKQLRTPQAQMPAFPPSAVSESEARDIHAFLKAIPPPPARVSAAPPPGPQTAASCLVCHGLDHTEITHVRGRVSEKVCAACHAQIYQEAVLDAGHSYGPGPAGIGTNWDRNVKVPHYAQMPRKVMEMGCDPCHAQAGATDAPFWDEQKKQYVDLSSLPYRNGCIACHTRHRFDPAEARRAEACMTCHMGPDHPNWEAYSTSKHGAIYLTDGQKWDWSKSMAEASYNAPTCAYCHMLYMDKDGKRSVSHNMTKKIIWGMGVQPAVGQLEDITRSDENRAKRNEMIRVCLN